MTDLRTAAQQALEALENAEDQLAKPYSTDASNAITALRAALAQQAEPVEPYCYVYEYDGAFGLHREFYPKVYNGHKPDRTVPVYTAPPQRKPLTEEMEARCPYAEANPTLRGAFFDGWLNSERAHGITGDESC